MNKDNDGWSIHTNNSRVRNLLNTWELDEIVKEMLKIEMEESKLLSRLNIRF